MHIFWWHRAIFVCFLVFFIVLPVQSTTVYQNLGLLCFDKYKGYVDLSYLCYSSQCVKIDAYAISVSVDREMHALHIETKIVIQNADETALSSKPDFQENGQKNAGNLLRCGTDCNGLNRRFTISNLNLDKGKYSVFHGNKELGAIYMEDKKGTLSKHTCFGDDGIKDNTELSIP